MSLGDEETITSKRLRKGNGMGAISGKSRVGEI